MKKITLIFLLLSSFVLRAQLFVPVTDQYGFKTPPMLQEESTLATPADKPGYGRIGVKTDNHLYFRDDLGNEYDLISFLIGGPGSFLALNDTPDDYEGHANELTYITRDEDSLIFTGGLTWNSEELDSALLIKSDDINSGFAHISNDFSHYATFNYHNIGLTDGTYATNIYPSSIWTPRISWAANETQLNWTMPDLLDFEDGPVDWYWHAALGGAGSVFYDEDGDGNLRLTPFSDIVDDLGITYAAITGLTPTYLVYGGVGGEPAQSDALYYDDDKLTLVGRGWIDDFSGSSEPSLYVRGNNNAGSDGVRLFVENYAGVPGTDAQAGIQVESALDSSYVEIGAYTGAGDLRLQNILSDDYWSIGRSSDDSLKIDWVDGATRTMLLHSKGQKTSLSGYLAVNKGTAPAYPLDLNGDFNISTGSIFRRNGTAISTLSGYGITDAVPSSRTISTTAPLTGGGDLSANRTISLPIPDGELVYGSGGTTVASSSLLKWDNSLGNLDLGGNGNSESYNMNLSEAAGRFEMALTGYAASETKLFLRAAGGTQSSPTATAAGDPLGVLGFIGYDGSSYASDASIGIKAVTSETWAPGAHGGYLIFSVCATGTTTASKKMRLNTDGRLYVGGQSAASFGIECATDISGTALYANGTGGAGFLELNTQASAPSTPATNDVRLFSNAGTLSWLRSDGFTRSFSSTLTANRTYTLQDASSTIAMYSNDLSVFAATTSAQLRGVLSDEIGTGPALFDGGTPSTGLTLTNCTGLPTTGLVNNAVTYAKMQQGGAYKMLANNTNASANYAEVPFEYHNSQTYTGTYAMIAGTTAPSGTTNHSYTWQRVGNVVTLDIWIIFGTNGTAVTSASVTLPADCPSPSEPPGLTGGSDRLYSGTGWMESNSTSSPGATRVMLRRNSGDTAYELVIVAGSSNGNYVHFNVVYYAQ